MFSPYVTDDDVSNFCRERAIAGCVSQQDSVHIISFPSNVLRVSGLNKIL